MNTLRTARGLALTAAGASLLGMGCGKDAAGPPPCSETKGTICTWAGTGDEGLNGDGKDRLASWLYNPIDLEFSPEGLAYIIDWNNHKIRRVNADGKLETVVGGEIPGDGPPDLSDLTEPGAPGTTVNLNHPTDLQFMPDGRLLIAAWHNHKIRRLDPVSGLVYVPCGRGAGFKGDMGPATMALLKQPKAIVLAASGDLFISDSANQRIRKIDTMGNINTVAGTGMKGFGGDGGPPAMAQFSLPLGENPEPGGALAIDGDNRLYVSDRENHRIRRIDFAKNTIETVAGTGTAGGEGDGGPGTMAQLHDPEDIEFGPDGRLFIADDGNNRIRALDVTTGTITTVAGTGAPGFTGDGGPAAAATFNRPYGIAFDAAGHMYVADMLNNRIRRITP